MDLNRRRFTAGIAAFLTSLASEAGAQAGYPPLAPGMAPPTLDNAPRFHEEQLRQQQRQRQDFDAFQRSQQRATDRNLETLRMQQRDAQRVRDLDRREGRAQERRLTDPRRQVQGRRRRRDPLTDPERARLDAATRRVPSSSVPSIIIEDPPPRRRRR